MSGATAINCTQCGAGLDVLGGGRVRAHVCGYCGAELDAQDNYKVLRQFRDMPRPESPFELGMEGEIHGVRMIVIGTIGRTETYAGRSWRWVDHQLYSPTHGYAWLSWENGNVTFTRKTRKVPQPAFISESTIENSESRPTAWLDGRVYRYYASGKSRISFVEGEFNWIPELDDQTGYVSLLAKDQMLNIAEGKLEREYELTELPDRAALMQSFGIDPKAWPAPTKVHPLSTFERSADASFARNVAFACSAVCLVLALFMAFMGDKIGAGTAAVGQTMDLPFTVTDGSKLVQVQLSANVDNSWAGLEAEVLDAEGETVFAFERGVEYYHGYDDGHWTEGSQTASVFLKLAEGQYRLTMTMTEADQYRPPNVIGAEIWQGVASEFWLWLGFVLFALIGAGFLAQRFLHEKRRMAGSDWSDE